MGVASLSLLETTPSWGLPGVPQELHKSLLRAAPTRLHLLQILSPQYRHTKDQHVKTQGQTTSKPLQKPKKACLWDSNKHRKIKSPPHCCPSPRSWVFCMSSKDAGDSYVAWWRVALSGLTALPGGGLSPLLTCSLPPPVPGWESSSASHYGLHNGQTGDELLKIAQTPICL